jgi:hypothetical protein
VTGVPGVAVPSVNDLSELTTVVAFILKAILFYAVVSVTQEVPFHPTKVPDVVLNHNVPVAGDAGLDAPEPIIIFPFASITFVVLI